MKHFWITALTAICISTLGVSDGLTQTADDEAAIRSLVAEWYEEHRAGPNGDVARLRAPHAIDASPGFNTIRRTKDGPTIRVYKSLAFQALKFDPIIRRLEMDPDFAKATVDERGYFYDYARQKATESAGLATFVFEKQGDGRWLVLVHKTELFDVLDHISTDPGIDLRELFYATQGRDRDPEQDARNKNKW